MDKTTESIDMSFFQNTELLMSKSWGLNVKWDDAERSTFAGMWQIWLLHFWSQSFVSSCFCWSSQQDFWDLLLRSLLQLEDDTGICFASDSQEKACCGEKIIPSHRIENMIYHVLYINTKLVYKGLRIKSICYIITEKMCRIIATAAVTYNP